jgi:hypothetical protein
MSARDAYERPFPIRRSAYIWKIFRGYSEKPISLFTIPPVYAFEQLVLSIDSLHHRPTEPTECRTPPRLLAGFSADTNQNKNKILIV